jgi:hypothetical protein
MMVARSSSGITKNEAAIAEICNLAWPKATEQDVIAAAWAYYYFSVQFRENLCLACDMFPSDEALMRLFAEECDTSNLSPFPGVALPGERLNHDEFMRRVLESSAVPQNVIVHYQEAGERYLGKVRAIDPEVRALSMASFEDGGLEAVFKAMLKSADYDHVVVKGFRFFLSEHIRFDSDPEAGHGSLSRHLALDDRVAELWLLFKDLLLEINPRLATDGAGEQVSVMALV